MIPPKSYNINEIKLINIDKLSLNNKPKLENILTFLNDFPYTNLSNPRIATDIGASDGYWRMNYTREDRLKKTFGPRLPIQVSGSVLDLGCNNGVTTEELCDLLPMADITGIDLDQRLIQLANSRPNHRAKYRVMDGYNSDFDDSTFNAVFCNNNVSYVVGDISSGQGIKIFNGISRVLAQGGYLVLSQEGLQSKYVVYKKESGGFTRTFEKGFSLEFLAKVDGFLCIRNDEHVGYTGSKDLMQGTSSAYHSKLFINHRKIA